MRFHFDSARHPLNIAKALKKALAARGKPEKSGRCQEGAAAMFGFGNWHELHENCRPGVIRSPWDDEVDETERSARRLLFEGRLAAKFGLRAAEAAAIVAEISPMGRRARPADGRPEWKRRMDEALLNTGFMAFRTSFSGNQLARMYRGRQSVQHPWEDRKFETSITHEGLDFEVLLSLTSNKADPDLGKVHGVEAVMLHGGEVVGCFDGTLVKPIRGSTEQDFFYACDCASERDARTAHLINSLVSQKDLYEHGRALLMVYEWEVARPKLPPRSGQAFLRGVAEILRRSVKRFGAVSITLDPVQFGKVEFNQRLSLTSFHEAVAYLRAHLLESAPEKMFGDRTKLLLLVENKRLTANRDLEGRLRMAAYRPLYEIPEGSADRFIEAITGKKPPAGWESEHAEFLKRQIETTETDPEQPQVIPPGGFPEGFDEGRAMTLALFKPHPELWAHMPDDLLQIDLHYARRPFTPDSFKRSCVLSSLTFRFANGTEFTMDSEHLLFGDKFEWYPEFMRTGTGHLLMRNPYTTRYSVSDLFSVLKINTALLFDGAMGKVTGWPDGTVSVTRPR